MCVVVACKLPVGPDGEDVFIICKNRDRNYVPSIHFKKRTKGSLEYRYIEDSDTTWTEGINSAGICMVNASLMVVDDEKEISKKSKKSQGKISHDAKIFKEALKMRDVRKAAKHIADNDVMGYTLVTDGRELYVVESVREWSKEVDPKTGKKYPVNERKSWRQVKDDEEFVVRTNHGTYFSETGYPSGSPDGKSSRHRQEAVENAIKDRKPKTLAELLECMAVKPNKDANLNPLRKKGKCKLFTTGQYILNPFTKSMYYYPVPGSCKMIEDGAQVSADDVVDKHDKTNMYVIDSYDEISTIGNIKEDVSFKTFFYSDWKGLN